MEIFLRVNFDSTIGTPTDAKANIHFWRTRMNRMFPGMKLTETINAKHSAIEPHMKKMVEEMTKIAKLLRMEEDHARDTGKSEIGYKQPE